MTRHHIPLFFLSLWLATPVLGQTLPVTRGAIEINGGYRMGTKTFTSTGTLRANAEDATYSVDHTLKSGLVFNVGGGYTVWKQLSLGVGLVKWSASTPGTLTGAVPHPFFFNKARNLTGPVSGVSRDELAIHIQARLVRMLGPKLQVLVFGGPSLFQVKQGLVSTLTWKDEYPYDSATLGAAQTATGTASGLGFNAGGDVAFFFAPKVGVGGGLQFSGASITMTSGTSQANLTAGGLQAGGGIRLRF